MTPSASMIGNGFRITFLRRPRGNPVLAGANAFVASLLFYLLIEILSAAIQADPPRMFVSWGFSTLLADSTLTLVAAWLLVRISGRIQIVWAVAAIALAATAATSLLIHWPLQAAALHLFRGGNDGAALALTWLSQAWWLFVLIALARWLMPKHLPKALLAAALAFAVSAMPWWWMPGAPLIMHDQAAAQQMIQDAAGDTISGSGFDLESTEEGASFDPERLMFDQPQLLGSAIAALHPRTPGKTNLYVVAFAGDGNENVFRNEAEYVEKLFSERFGADGHMIILENNPASIDSRPLATLTNLRLSLDAIAERMDPAEDILLLYLTSHGSHDHQLYVALDPLPLNQITPEDLADALNTTPPMRWKVIIVNACFSGGFIDALRDDSSMVITAARSDRSSFGCGSESEITYFGNAFLADALNETTSITEAFAKAKATVAEWEARDDVEEPSEPQIASSPGIEAKLDAWREGLPAHAPVPFTPAENRKH
ncbi:MAG TPA: C13 family peptidase [Dokdonella sp.]|uniref:C13 family peptidase n=1 Tax=Dokdonella sp. TaxID=2291710 RepID=UPI002D7F8C07|nr:C13 family peptidase [Dokdonella sp.]HET9034100.1 C13 family peptidase [Dokdonella sp.]